MSTTTAIAEAVTLALKDLLKFKIVGYVNTGDKTQDSLVNTFLLAVLTMVFATMSWNSIIIRYRMWKSKRACVSSKLDIQTICYYKSIIQSLKPQFRYGTWYTTDDKEGFTDRVASYYLSIYSNGSASSPMLYDFNTSTFLIKPNGDSINILRKNLTVDSYEPIYADKEGIVCLYKDNSNTILIVYSSDETLNAFLKVLKCDNIIKGSTFKKNDSNRLNIHDNLGNRLGYLYPDRTFDIFVSKHKKFILEAVQGFNNANREGADFGGYGSYNLGLMVHGDYGTGKTLMVKALANLLKRDIKMIDMRDIKTRQDFEDIFVDVTRYIYCLDEFDCIQGTIVQRTSGNNEVKENPTGKEMRELRERHLEILKLVVAPYESDKSKKDKKDKKDNEDEEPKMKNPLVQELDNITKRIKEIENALTLDSILTVLDGVNEMRGRVIVATTNHLEKIDKALMRAGRFDLKIRLSKFNHQEITDMLILMFKKRVSAEELETITTAKFKEDTFAPVDVIFQATTKKSLAAVIEALT